MTRKKASEEILMKTISDFLNRRPEAAPPQAQLSHVRTEECGD